MARFEILDGTAAPLGEGPAAGDMLFELGMMYSVGRDMPVDLISAHKWFNLAAVKGNREAIRLRREIADPDVGERNRCRATGGARLAKRRRRDAGSGIRGVSFFLDASEAVMADRSEHGGARSLRLVSFKHRTLYREGPTRPRHVIARRSASPTPAAASPACRCGVRRPGDARHRQWH